MVEGGRFPSGGGVAGPTVRTELPSMRVAIFVAGIAVNGSALVNIIGMATCTGGRGVFAGQFEVGHIMVEGGRFPGGGGVAGTTVCTELAIMTIILLMAGIAVGGCTLEDIIAMTAQACGCGVFAGQLKGGQVVVEGGWFPGGGGVAGTTVCTVLAIMPIILLMAGITVCRYAFVDAIDMALRTGSRGMLAR